MKGPTASIILALLMCSALVSAQQDPGIQSFCDFLEEKIKSTVFDDYQEASRKFSVMKRLGCDTSRAAHAFDLFRSFRWSKPEDPELCNNLRENYMFRYQRWINRALYGHQNTYKEAEIALTAVKKNKCDYYKLPLIDPIPKNLYVLEEQKKCVALVEEYLNLREAWVDAYFGQNTYEPAKAALDSLVENGCDISALPKLYTPHKPAALKDDVCDLLTKQYNIAYRSWVNHYCDEHFYGPVEKALADLELNHCNTPESHRAAELLKFIDEREARRGSGANLKFIDEREARRGSGAKRL